MNLLCNMCDSIAAKICEMAFKHQQEIEATSTKVDPCIVFWICLTIVAIALISALTITVWQLVNLLRVNSADRRKRRWDRQDKNREQIAKLQEKELEYKKDLVLPDNDRKFTHTAINAKDPYLDAIISIIKELKNNTD